MLVSDQEAARIPEGVSDDDAAAVSLVGLTALQALRDIAHLKRGARVWIHGASGGVGTIAIQIARTLGAEVTTTSSATNLALCTELGAHRAFDYREAPAAKLRGAIDVVFDVFGNLKLDEIDGRGICVSTVPSPKRAVLEIATRWSRLQERLIVAKARRVDLEQLGAWLASRTIRSVIDSRFPLSRVHEAFRVLESKRARGKVLVEIA